MSRPGSRRDARTDESEDKGRTPAEWASLIISSSIVLALVVVLVYLYVAEGTNEPYFDVQPQLNELTRHGDEYYLPVTVENLGGETAEDVRVLIMLKDPIGEDEMSEFSIDFLAAGATSDGVAVFRGDP